MNIQEEKQKYADIIRKLIPINELPQDVQNEIIKNTELITLKKKQQVFKQGDRDNFSYYLLAGEIQLEANNQVHNSIAGSSDRAQYPMAQLQPRQFSGVAKLDSVVMRIDRNALDKLLVMHQGKNDAADDFGDGMGTVEVDEIDGDEEEDVDWMTRMLQSEIFSGMPISNIHQLFALLEPNPYKAGDNVITQGESGNHYYIIQEGRCEVLRQSKPGMKETKLAELKAGDGFGEEALITETTRNATIRMLTDGVVAQLSKDNFVTLIQNTALKAVTSEKAAEIVKQGGKWLDVRFKNEHDRSTVAGSLHIPLNILRMQADKLDPKIHYVAFCDTGGRSSTASFLLTERGLTVSYLNGGLVNHPELAPDEDISHIPKASESSKPPPAAPEKKATSPAKPAAEPGKPPVAPGKQTQSAAEKAPAEADEEMDPEIMATVLNAELTHNTMQIERAKKQDQNDLRNQQVAKKLEEERARIEAQKKRVEADVQKLRKQEAERLKKMEQEAEKRMQEERKKIEEVYSRNAEEMEKLEKMKQESEEKMRVERERMEKQAAEAQKNKEDAEKIRHELDAARKAMEEETKKRQLEQEEMRKRIEMEARKKIEIERRKLAEQFAKNNQEVEQARREKAIAEAARAAAKQEAELMIEEYKSQHDKSREEEEQRIKAERIKLEEEQNKIRQALQDIQKARSEADALKRAALAEITALKAKQYQEDITKSEVAKAALKDKIKGAQQKLAKASEKAAKVEEDEEKAVVAQKVNQEDLQKKKAEEEALAKQLHADLEGFKEELAEQEREYASATTQLEHMKRIKERAEAAKREALDANTDLISDVSAQLGDKT
jgi:CRP-like cAMP-binding protein